MSLFDIAEIHFPISWLVMCQNDMARYSDKSLGTEQKPHLGLDPSSII